MITPVKTLVDDAKRVITSISVNDAIARHADGNDVFIDIRDIREAQREGTIPESFHAPRGMLEFWVDPSSPYHKDVFASGKKLVFYCQSGWRSALATKAVQDMGLEHVCHIGDGYRGWKDSGAPTEEVVPKKR